jgi:hypothetical protein
MHRTEKSREFRSHFDPFSFVLSLLAAFFFAACTGSVGTNDSGHQDGDEQQDDGNQDGGDLTDDGGNPTDDGGNPTDDGGSQTDCGDTQGEVFGAEPNPTCNPIGGGPGYSRIIAEADNSVTCTASTKLELINCLSNANPDDVIFVRRNADIDMTGTPPVTIKGQVTLASDRGLNGSPGGLIKRKENLNGGWEEPMFVAGGDDVRVTGLQLEGEMFPQDYGNGKPSCPDYSSDNPYPGSLCEQYYLVGIYANNRSGFEVDNNEMRGWAWSAVSLQHCTLAHIHHNYIHHNQSRGEAYGTNLYGGSALLEGNLYDYNRHDITGAGWAGEQYEARYNIIRGNGDAIGASHFDVHQDEMGGDFAGDRFLMHHNTFQDGIGIHGMKVTSVHIRHRPDTGCFIYNNRFESISTEVPDGVPIYQTNSDENLSATNNLWMGVLYPDNDGIVWFQ